MQILLIADIHANSRALQAVLDAHPEADEIWCFGDIVEYGPSPMRCIELIRRHCHHVVQGNHDVSYAQGIQQAQANIWLGADCERVHTADADYLIGLPQQITVSVDGVSYYLVHGSPRNPLSGSLKPNSGSEHLQGAVEQVEADVIVCGHTHMAMLLPVGNKTIVNVGTVGQPRDGDYRAQCMVIEDGIFYFERIPYDLETLAQDYARSSLPEPVRQVWLDYSRRGIVDVHGLQSGPFSREHPTVQHNALQRLRIDREAALPYRYA